MYVYSALSLIKVDCAAYYQPDRLYTPHSDVIMLCGDEVGANVVDMGNSLCRFGSAGYDTPSLVMRTDVGYKETSPNDFYIGDSALRVCREGMEIKKAVTPESIDWCATESILKHGIRETNRGNSDVKYPLLLAENYFSTNERKEKMLEILFESMQLPAAYFCHNAALSSFCFARQTSLIVDIGASHLRVVPVVDGFALTRSMVCSNQGGNYFDDLVKDKVLKGHKKIQLSSFQPPSVFGKQTLSCVSNSFLQMHTSDTIRDLKHWMSFISSDKSSGSSSDVADIPPYELPDGTLIYPSEEICKCVERDYFSSTYEHTFEKFQQRISIYNRDISMAAAPLPELVFTAVANCDVDIRRELLNNIILVGGGSLCDGIATRLAEDISKVAPSCAKAKVIGSQDPIEKHHAAWIGGSILSICGSFQQMWISREDYVEYGPSVHMQKSNN